jgi:hypothetical protein
MRNIFLSFKKVIITAVILAGIMISCRKETISARVENLKKDNLGLIDFSDQTIEMSQAIRVYDSTRIKDSIDFANPPSDKYYEWRSLPAGCDSIVGNQHLPEVTFIFHCPGTHFIIADIYDPATNTLIGNTDTIKIQVSADTLRPSQPIQKHDILNLTPSIVKLFSSLQHYVDNAPDEVYIQFVLTSTDVYNYGGDSKYNYSVGLNSNTYSFVFSDSISLLNYPFARGFGKKYTVQEVTSIHGLKYGVANTLNVTWLGKTYTGTITLIDEDHWTSNWDNNSPVRM